MRRGVSLFVIVLLGAALAATVARADTGTTTTDTTTTDASTITTSTTTTTDTTTTETTTTTASPTYVTLSHSHLPSGCVGAGFAAIEKPNGAVVALGLPDSALGASEYPASHPYITFDSGTKTSGSCTSDHVSLANLSLFGGAVTAARVAAIGGKGRVIRLELNGSRVTLASGETVAVGSWGLLTRRASGARLSAPLALRLVHRHGSVPAGTTIFVGFAATPQRVTPPVVHSHKKSQHGTNKPSGVPQPLTTTPYLGFKSRHYVFPIAGGASYVDTYGAGRNDIYDGWHHGDDLFAPLGTPVVAVANGTLSPIGWDGLGGWRLWLTDNKGNSFYYAHLAGYSRRILHHRHVTAGQVIGFLGRTGDAFTTEPHLHFEIHPHQLVALGYDGAVDPTTYLQSWSVETVPESQIPAAAKLRAPAGTPTQEAAVVWKELLTARHLMADGQPLVALVKSVRRPFPATKEAPFVDVSRLASGRLNGDGLPAPANPWPLVTLAVALACLAAAGSLFVARRRRSI